MSLRVQYDAVDGRGGQASRDALANGLRAKETLRVAFPVPVPPERPAFPNVSLACGATARPASACDDDLEHDEGRRLRPAHAPAVATNLGDAPSAAARVPFRRAIDGGPTHGPYLAPELFPDRFLTSGWRQREVIPAAGRSSWD